LRTCRERFAGDFGHFPGGYTGEDFDGFTAGILNGAAFGALHLAERRNAADLE